MAQLLSFQAVLRGRVQGVGFRYFARQRAEVHGIAGFVRNLPDGSVEIHAEGEEAALRDFEADIRRGPSFGKVEEASVIPVEARGFERFEIR
jgi:acylphosphatase